MALVIVTEDAAFKCAACGNLIQAKKGQLLPPCPRCGGKLEKFDGPAPATDDACCGR
jgi:Zn finger protein HypA/HybF involved in hydrogenase expression